MKKSYLFYIPIILTVITGFILGGCLSFGVVYLDFFPNITHSEGRKILALFGIGMLGVSTFCARAWAKDIYEVVYENDEFLPHFFDFVGYITLIIGGGITGVILYFIFKTGIGVGTTTNTEVNLTKEASALIAYIGGLYHFKVQAQLGKMIDKMLEKNTSDNNSHPKNLPAPKTDTSEASKND